MFLAREKDWSLWKPKKSNFGGFRVFLGENVLFFCSFYIKGGSSPVYDIRSVTHIVSNIHLLMILKCSIYFCFALKFVSDKYWILGDNIYSYNI